MEAPLVSLCITCYNQGAYVGKALASALNQTYSPLEIVICDDNSTDGTDEILKGLIKKYLDEGGMHKVVFCRNEKNLGVVKNYEKCFKLSHGRLIVTGAGDDVSYSNRVSRIVEAWQVSGERASVLCHGADLIGMSDEVKGVQSPPNPNVPIGAMMAYDRAVVDMFPEVVEELAFEDDVFSRRALLIGEPLMIDESLMKYRVGSGVSTSGNIRERRLRVAMRCLASARQARIDLEHCNVSVPKVKHDKWLLALERYELFYGAESEMIMRHTVLGRFEALCTYTHSAYQKIGVKGFCARLIRFVLKLRS